MPIQSVPTGYNDTQERQNKKYGNNLQKSKGMITSGSIIYVLLKCVYYPNNTTR